MLAAFQIIPVIYDKSVSFNMSVNIEYPERLASIATV
jgi:hypothetical protein